MRALNLSLAALLGLSVANYMLSESFLHGPLLIAAVLGAVFIKFALVMGDFMELRHRGRAWLAPGLGFMAVMLIALGLAL